jgi:hypothetical protein
VADSPSWEDRKQAVFTRIRSELMAPLPADRLNSRRFLARGWRDDCALKTLARISIRDAANNFSRFEQGKGRQNQHSTRLK